MPVPAIIASFIGAFVQENDLSDLEQSLQFEHLMAFLLFRQLIHDRFQTVDVISGRGETGIDAACVVLDGNLIVTEEDARQFFGRKLQSSSVLAEVAFMQAKLSDSFKREEILGFGMAVRELLQRDEQNALQDDYLLEIGRIIDVLHENAAKIDLDRARCRLTYVTLGEWKEPAHAVATIEQIRKDVRAQEFFTDILFEPFDRNSVRRLWNDATRAQETKLPTVSRFPFPHMPGVENAVVALVRATEFVDCAIRAENGSMRVGIFDQNIRDFEGESNPVNAKIRKTLEGEDSRARFGVMNNGITIVAHEIRPAADSYILTGYQIVNGCQTSNVLERNRDQLTDDVLLQVRLIQTKDPRVLNDVIEATNSQTSVPPYQFIANSRLAVETQELFATFPEATTHRLHFERRKSELSAVAAVSNTKVVTIPDLAKTFGAIFLEEPHHVASAPNQAFSVFQDRLFKDEHSPLMYYTAAFAHYRLYLLKVAGRLKIPQHRLYWHVLTCSKRLAAGKPPSKQTRKAWDKYCNAFLKQLWEPSDALKLFERAHESITNSVTQIDRDRLRTRAFTNEYLSKL